MPIEVKTGLIDEASRYGAFDIRACFNCGNCTAVCPLSEEGASFPRRMIRLGQLGAKDAVLRAPEPWLCYYCGECSETCPREAEPGEYMASLRRLQIASLDPTGVAGLQYRSPAIGILLSIVVALGLGALLVTRPSDAGAFPRWAFGALVPYEAVHLVGLFVSVALGGLMLVAVARFASRIGLGRALRGGNVRAALRRLAPELTTMRRQRECRTESAPRPPFLLEPRVVHLFIMWGFLALALATALDFLFVYGLGMEMFLPARIVGTIGGIAMLAGVALAVAKRASGREKASRHTRFADGWLLFYLLVLAVTGFWLEIVVTLGVRGEIHDAVLLVHAVMAMELVLFVGVTKLAHAVYRPLALFAHFARQPEGDA
ncbi:MAG: 4Fe-4S dicluster domain-containing protein [Proteobacteria bacterium]|jgi:ferredoxin|nr:4Fe-4S dicluster domain-containing protein [Pseudomonadota bacterium]